ncbi:putative membrane protein, partial [Vibrio parahaemolyticus V-223/04]
FIR